MGWPAASEEADGVASSLWGDWWGGQLPLGRLVGRPAAFGETGGVAAAFGEMVRWPAALEETGGVASRLWGDGGVASCL